ncbi:hypothetical protein [Planctomycetes bacterium Pla163]|uniref:hypothetical protein n=1 Tax=Rohdeia mirabilis TaxID=2528008 RepID=UPI0011A8EC24
MLALALLGAAFPLALAGCDGAASADRGATREAYSNVPLQRQLQDMIDALAEADAAAGVSFDSWVDGVRAAFARADRSSPDLGRAIIALLDERDDLDPGIRSRLIEAAARSMAKDEEARGELGLALTERIENYSSALGERNKACELLGAYCPQTAIAVLGPLLLPDRRGTTLPDSEFILAGYLTAAKTLGTDTHDILCAIAVEARMDGRTRTIALRELAPQATPRSIAIFENVMVESTGDAYLRRVAVQSYIAAVPKERALEHLTRTRDREADMNMQGYLEDVLATLRGER